MNKEKAGHIAVRELLKALHTNGQELVDSGSPLPLVHRIEEANNGWTITILFGERYYFDAHSNGTCKLFGFSYSKSTNKNWYYPDARFNPPEGNLPVVEIDRLKDVLEKDPYHRRPACWEDSEDEDDEDIPW